jgi:hypothetical protein
MNGTPPNPQPPQAAEQYQTEPGEQEISEDVAGQLMRQHINMRLVDMLTHDRTGDDAAASIQDMFPQIAIQMRFATVEMLHTEVEHDPILQQIAGDPRLPNFLKEFHDYFHKVDEGETDEPTLH